MDDLVQRLRELAARKWPDAGNREASLFGRAADEIERLRTALRYQDDRDGHIGTHGPGAQRAYQDAWIRHDDGTPATQAEVWAELTRLRSEVSEWNKLRDPVTLHVSLLRGFPSQLDRATFLHIAGDEPLHMHPDLVAKLPAQEPNPYAHLPTAEGGSAAATSQVR